MSEEDSEAKDTVEESLGIRFPELASKLEEGGDLPPAFQFLEKYFPDKDDYDQKTRISSKKIAQQIAKFKIIEKLYPEISNDDTSPEDIDMGDSVQEYLDNVEKLNVSVEGKSRDEYEEILKALLQGLHEAGAREGKDTSSIMRSLFTTGEDEE